MAHYITRRGLSIVAFWHLLSPRRRLDLAASHRPLPCPVALLSSPSFAPAMHRTAGPLARVPGVRDGRVSAPYFEPSWATLASTGRQSTAWATQTARPTSAFDRAAPTASVACVGWQAASAQPLVGVPTALLSPLPPARGTPRTRPSSGAQGGTFSACLGPPRLHARHRDQGGGLGGPDEARAARLGAACRPSLAGAAHHAQAYAEEPVAPVAHELVARIDRAVQLSHALPTIKFETTNIRPQKRPARAARAGERLASQPASS